MKDLIQALQILSKYENPTYPTHCEHDELYILVNPLLVSKEDLEELKKLGLRAGDDCFISTKFGSA